MFAVTSGAVEPRSAEIAWLPSCVVSLIDDVTLASQEEGVMRELLIHEGSIVKASQVVAKLDDREAVSRLRIAEGQLAITDERRRNDVDVRLAQAQAEVKKFEHENTLAANRVVADVVGQIEVRKIALGLQEATLTAEKAQRDLEVLNKERRVRELEIEAAKLGVQRRLVESSIDGVVVQRFVDPGEWVRIGDPVCRVIRLDNLWVEGLLEAKRYRPQQIEGRPVEISIKSVEGANETLPGLVVFVDPQVDGNGRFRVRAAIENRKREGHWVLQPGQLAEMTIRSAAAAAKSP